MGSASRGFGAFDPPGDEAQGEEDDQVAGHPGTDLINPGEFLLGYRRQGDAGDRVVPAWMQDGSFHVIRRLAQDVPGWWAQVEARSAGLSEADAIDTDLLAAKLVGRWRSGTPLAKAPEHDLRSGRDPGQDNDFEYDDDPDGHHTPRFAHIRRVYPRKADPPGETKSELHRIIRRGIPFGLPLDPGLGRGHGVDAERGLVFAAFISSIEDQFEFLQATWANNVEFPSAGDGSDRVIGVESDVTLEREDHGHASLHFTRFVTTEGSLYAFAPSLSTLRRWRRAHLSSQERLASFSRCHVEPVVLVVTERGNDGDKSRASGGGRKAPLSPFPFCI